ncbi:MAG: hypothetical protein KJ864_07225 [Candidatus Omnitrophica bacterium]|nr:hypothetical protein [Candidatus Omnitrophota bacterium]
MRIIERSAFRIELIMPLIRVTQKLQKEIGIKPADLERVRETSELFTEWYAHVFLLNRRKQIIFVEPQTLFSFSISNVSRKDIRERLSTLFERGLSKALFVEGASGEVMSKMMNICRDGLSFSKTENRKTLGVMNEFIKQHKFAFWDNDRSTDIQDWDNRYMPMGGFLDGSKDLEFPLEVFAKILKEKFDLNFIPKKEEHFKQIFNKNITEHQI